MKKLQIIAITAAMALVACDSKNVKPLIGGIRNAEETIEKINGNGDYASGENGDNEYSDAQNSKGKGESGTGRQGKGLEIPARLTGVSEQILYRTGYTTSYNKDTRLPN